MHLIGRNTLFYSYCSSYKLCVISIHRIPDAFGRDIEKSCQSIYPLHDVYIRKVKVLKKPKFDGKVHVT